jgi:hypothetical protein
MPANGRHRLVALVTGEQSTQVGSGSHAAPRTFRGRENGVCVGEQQHRVHAILFRRRRRRRAHAHTSCARSRLDASSEAPVPRQQQ